MSKNKKIKRNIQFYKSELHIKSGDELCLKKDNHFEILDKAVNYINTLPFIDSLEVSSKYLKAYDNSDIYFELISSDEFYLEGKMILSRKGNLPSVENRGELTPLPIPESAGLAEITHFVFFKKYDIFGLEYNYHAPKANKIGSYFEKKYSQEITQLNLRPILNHDIDKKLQEIGEISILEIQANRNALNELEELNESLCSAFESSFNVSGNEVVEIILKRQRYSKETFQFPLNIEPLKRFLKQNIFRENVPKLRTEGLSKIDNKKISIDFFEDKFILQKEINTIGLDENKRIESDSMIKAIKEAFNDIKSQIVLEK